MGRFVGSLRVMKRGSGLAGGEYERKIGNRMLEIRYLHRVEVWGMKRNFLEVNFVTSRDAGSEMKVTLLSL